MKGRAIVEYPDERLRAVARPVQEPDDALGCLIDDLADTLLATDGLGLSAPQLGVAQRVLVLRGEGDTTQVFVNPRLLSSGGFAITLESCLSLPGVRANVWRPSEVCVAAVDRHGEPFERTLSGLPAVCLQHELDHLDGRLFIDRVSRPRRWLMRAPLVALQRRHRPPASHATA